MPEKQDDTSVRVAVRIRPQLAREKIDACRVCTAVSPDEPQIILGPDRMFTYDNVFDMDSQQDSLYQKTVHDLIEGCFEGYNATVFAYGQTGSGKTYSMGTGFEPGLKEDQKGIIPRAVRHLFTGIEERRRSATERSEPPPEFKIYAEFMELYNEEVLDLFDTTRDMESSRHKKSHIKIHEDAGGGIYVVGVTTRTVTSEPETLQALQGGALSRTTASTKMNSQSSRSHAIFTLHIKQQRLIKVTTEIEGEGEKEAEKAEGDGMNEFEMLTAKFHFVDLAGSERLKRTGATGDRAKEGISINCGLLALGNVISALGDPTKRSSHVPYRDSKLTRLLQDSLGGNSRTLMIACVSPSDQDFMETLNTLRYANRARNIKNAVIANQDKTSRQLALLRTEIKRLQDELNEYKQGKRSVNSEGVEEINDLFHENTLLQMENGNLRLRIKALQETIDGLTARVALLVAEQARYGMSASTDRSCYTMPADLGGTDGDDETMTMMTGYIKEVEELRAKLVESESMNSALRRKNVDSPVRVNSRASMMNPSHGALRPSSAIFTAPIFENEHYGDEGVRVASVLSDAKKQVEADQEKIRQVEKRRDSHGGSEKDMESCEEVTDESHESVQDHETEGTKEERGEEDEEEKEEEDADDEDDDDKDSSSSSDSESDEEENAQLQENLAELACEITIKQRLIEELEHSQKRLHTMKMQYEEKLGSLLDKIKETESERDKVLDNLGSMAESRTKDKAEKIRKEFEIKLKKLSEEKDRLTKVQKEHNKILKSKSQFERQMKGLKDEVFKMKETKVKLMKQIREEQQKGRNKDQLSSREIQRLKKESRKKETQIKTLEASAKQRELILKRKHEQLEMLRKNQKPMSDKVAGRLSRPVKKPSTAPSTAPAETGQRVLSRRGKAKVDTGRPSKHERKGTSEYSSKTARQKWNKMERKITDIIARRQTISYMERDMERFIHHRHKLSKKVEKYLTKRDEALKAGNKDPSVQKDLDEQIDGLNDNMEYVQEQITECQSGIMEVMEGKEEIDAVDAAAVIEQCSLREAKYMLEHFINLAINKGLSAAQKESQVKELEAKLHQEEQNSFVQQTLLQHMMKEREGEDLDLDGLFSNPNLDSESSSNSSRAPSPVDISALNALAVNVPDHTTLPHIGPANSVSAIPIPSQTKAKDKMILISHQARRRTATSEELLGFKGTADFTPDPAVGVVIESDETSSSTDTASVDSSLVFPSSHIPIRKDGRLEKLSPALRRKNITQLQALSNPSSVDHTPDHTPPGSPPPSRTGNVFSRLAQTNSPAQSQKDRGSIIPVINKPTTPRAPLVCSYTAEGHSKAVLSVQATEELLFSGSKDRSVKIWKLDTGKEIATLAGHTNNVGVVRYCEKLKLVFSVSTAFIRIWDIRDTQKCVTTLSSSGMQLDKTAGSSSSRTVTLPQGETQINDIAINESGTRLYSAAGNIVRVWDLSSFQSMCKLFGGPSAAVMCLDVKTTPQFDQVFAGSKDHYVKMFEVEPGASGCLTSSFNFDPPHYDGIQSMAIRGNSLFSGSRDACIKKWDLDQKQLSKAMSNAHKDWICALDFLPSYNCLLSGCRGGYLKLWNIDTCTPVGEMKAHTSPINSIATNSTHVFTASSDEIKLWRKSESTRLPSL
ncbi:kinesin-like protein KIF21A isoform X10 [Strongylocentrotus purpuratus]|uniref:Kinesin motor domain-containing protein n=1 Tax=Strongylocentrotus purpuratus TaxID=7668 RepID=A0A7M7PD31_STRPU|nr:kinesin-like protein KIF21A isoform X10 [Strongylocentrotus purpuratus]